MKKFEYCYLSYENGEITFSNSKIIQIDLNHCGSAFDELGKNGWEMVGCGNVRSMHVVYFKRERSYYLSGSSEAVKYYLQNNHLRIVNL